MTKEVTKPGKELSTELSEKDALAKWQKQNPAFKNTTNKIVLNNIPLTDDRKPNPDFGKIFAYSYDEDGEETKIEMKKGAEFHVPISRVQVKGNKWIDKDSDGYVGPEFTIKEVESGEDIVVVEGKTKEVIYTGPYKDVKEQYNLKYQVALYVYYEGTVYRWCIGGQSISSWFDVDKAITKKGHPAYVKLVDIISQKNDAKIFWNDLVFEVGENFDVRTTIALGDKIRASFLSKTEEGAATAKKQIEGFGAFVKAPPVGSEVDVSPPEFGEEEQLG